ncbi:hypothetical protein [Loigolactobacillus bifermentans]|jgi:hypothetical protein|uniref:Antitoxin of toxin-antitoxin stability system n=1 Tax=Loigolactobacillus bifermentans DSM 20003 TaxID=1423726 RepID=A0A0R1GKX6_9LACO|nr:hypothetical protein [Loigolactobacillus bifermentans]KRK34654.1 hypothetical protein FC07_GL000406 [Loigolactobacillus bifermentans DSM 20003]
MKPRKVGTSTVLTVPKNIKITADDYDVFSGRDGAIIYLPKTKNPFTDPAFIKAHLNAYSDQDFIDTSILPDEF